MTIQSFEAIIFDHDGTLVNTELPDFLAWEALYQEYGATITMEYWAEVAVGHLDGYGQLFADLIGLNGNGLTETVLHRRLKELWAVTLESVGLMPGVEVLLPQLRQAGYPLAVATASDRNWVTRWLTHLDLLSYFQVVANKDDVPNNKPAPDVYLFAARQLAIEPARCLVFEDSRAGLQAAKAAGMTVVAVATHVTRSLDFSQADAVVSSLEEVTPAWIEAFEKRKRRVEDGG